MDPRTIEINNLRVLNDYLNQTIEAITRARLGGLATGLPFAGGGLSHSPYATSPYAGSIYGASPFATSPFATTPFATSPFAAASQAAALGATIDPTGLSHSTFAGVSPFGVSPLANSYAPVLDPFGVSRGLSHTPVGSIAGMHNPVVDIVRQQQIQQAVQLQQLQAAAMWRATMGLGF